MLDHRRERLTRDPKKTPNIKHLRIVYLKALLCCAFLFQWKIAFLSLSEHFILSNVRLAYGAVTFFLSFVNCKVSSKMTEALMFTIHYYSSMIALITQVLNNETKGRSIKERRLFTP